MSRLAQGTLGKTQANATRRARRLALMLAITTALFTSGCMTHKAAYVMTAPPEVLSHEQPIAADDNSPINSPIAPAMASSPAHSHPTRTSVATAIQNAPGAASDKAQPAVVRAQSPTGQYAAGNGDYFRQPMQASGTPNNASWGNYQPTPTQPNWNQDYSPPSTSNWGVQNSATAPQASPWTSAPTGTGIPAATGAPPAWGDSTAPATSNWGNGTGQAPGQTVYTPNQIPAPGSGPAAGGPWGGTNNTPAAPPWNGTPALGGPAFGAPGLTQSPEAGIGVPAPLTDIIVNASEAQTGRLQIGAAVNSDAGVTGQFVLDEKHFDWRRWPRGWDDLPNAFRGAGQTLRVEAMPGSRVQRYVVRFADPYLFNTRISFSLSGFLFERSYFDWNEQRLGGEIGFGYRVTPDLSVQAKFRGSEIKVTDPRVPDVDELNEALGDNDLYGIQLGIIQDTRDIPFAPTQGYYLELSYEQVMGSFDYPRGIVDFRRYFLVTERPDGSGRHVLGFSHRLGVTGSQTPIYENFFAGGYSTLRGFEYRGATPLDNSVAVGGELSILGSVEYRFPISADDMVQGVVFCDYGTIEEDIDIDWDDYRVSLGAGFRISMPALSAAPIALDFSVPVAREDTDSIQNFAFFIGVSR